MSGFKFECFYYPTIEHGEVVKTTRNVRSFEFGEEVPTKTLYYNYGKNFAIYQGSRIVVVEDGILKGEITKDELKFPLKLVFDKGTQLTIFSKEDLNSIRLLMAGEHEIEKELEFHISDIKKLINSESIPTVLNKPKCKKCAYYEYCYI